MNTSARHKAKDPIDVLIFEKGLRIKNLVIDKELDLMVLILNTGKVLEGKISDYPKLKAASSDQLNSWKLISGGIGATWETLNEDLSMKGFIKAAAMKSILHDLLDNQTKIAI